MEFNHGKCQTMTITRKRKFSSRTYVLHNKLFERVSEAKHLGITISQDLKWNTHILKLLAVKQEEH